MWPPAPEFAVSEKSAEADEATPETGAPPPPGEAGEKDPDLGEAGGVFGQAVLGLARVLVRRGKEEARRAAQTGRLRLDLRQLRKDRDAMYGKLGRELRHLVEGGEITHPGVHRGLERIAELEERIRRLEGELAAAGEVEPDPMGEAGSATATDDGATGGGG